MSNRERRFLVLILIAAVAARLFVITLDLYAPDQSFTVDLGGYTWRGLIDATAQDTHPPLFYALVKIWFMLTPHTLQWAQAFTVLFAVPTLLVIFLLGRDLFSPAAGWIGLLFAAFTPYQVFWSHVARNHQLLALAVPLLVWTTYRWVGHPGERRWWAMAASMALMIQTNYLGIVMIPVWLVAFGAFEVSSWPRRRSLAMAVVPGAMLFLPWIPILIGQVRHGPMNRIFFQETVWPFYLFFHSIIGRASNHQPIMAWQVFTVLAAVFTIVFAYGFKAVGRRWSWWILMIGMPTLPVLVAYCCDFTLAERHINFGMSLFMCYWGAAVIETGKAARRSFCRGKAARLSDER